MDKAKIKKFAVWARTKLISDITYKAGMLGITENGIAEPMPQSTADLQLFDMGLAESVKVIGKEVAQRNALVSAIRNKEKDTDYKTAFETVIEEVAYTWFNRLIAIRFMEVNDYLPSGVRVLSSENPAKNEPDIVTMPFDSDLEFTEKEREQVLQLKDDNKLDELFRILFIKQCNKLNEILPELFEETDDYTELLLSISFTDSDGIVAHLVNDVAEDDFNVEKEGQVEIIGWLYQYYISEKHEEVIDPLKGKVIKKEDIPAATQLFTTDWVVKYMVDNSLGRYWIERNPDSKLAEKLEFFVTPKDGNINYIDEKVAPQDLTFFDPCMGSGHILIYAFDVLMHIYRERGYSDRDAALSIVENNLFGLDIDKRAYQLAYFAVMMKARSYNRRVLTNGTECNLTEIEESNAILPFECNDLINGEQRKVVEYLVSVFENAKEIGSLIAVDKNDYKAFSSSLDTVTKDEMQMDMLANKWFTNDLPLIKKFAKQANILSLKYAVVCTNPPYMNKLPKYLKEFVTENYKEFSGDLFSVFMRRNFDFCKQDGYSAFMTPNVWMFIKTYEKLRNFIISEKSIVSLIQMAKGAFFKEATVDICAFILSNNKNENKGLYFRLEDFKGDMKVQEEKVLEAIENKECDYFYETSAENFSKIPGSPVAYWVSDSILKAFIGGELISNFATTRTGIMTGDNGRFLRLWWEVVSIKICLNAKNVKDATESEAKWFPYNKGGEYRKWYGNNDYIVNWENSGNEIFGNAKIEKRNAQDYPDEYKFKSAISWSLVTSGEPSFRLKESNLSDIAGPSLYTDTVYTLGLLAFCNSIVAIKILNMMNPTINLQAGNVGQLPILLEKFEQVLNMISNENIKISIIDWNSFETSWDFKRHPLVGESL